MKSRAKIFLSNIYDDQRFETCKNEINSYFIINKMNGYFEEINENKYLIVVSTNESKEIMKKIYKLWSKIRDLIRSITKNSNDHDKKYMKVKFDLDDVLPLNTVVEIHGMIIAIRAFFQEHNKYYPQVFLD